MTEIPEHLLRRSKERRSALGLGGEGGGGDAPPPEGGAPAEAAASAPSTAVAPAAAPAPAPVAAAAPPAPPPPPYVVAALTRRKIPFWAVPVLAVLPVWGFVYAGSLATPEEELSDPVLVLGEQVYAQCSGCHGANGEGGTGRPLNGGEVLLTFPELEDHVAWVAEGSALVGGAGNPYGNPDRSGGQRISGSEGYGQMPGFGDALSEEELIAVSRYEREVLSGGAAAGGGEGGETAEGGGEAEGSGEGDAEDGGEGGDAGGGGGSTDDGGAAANEDGAGEDTGSDGDGAGATDGGGGGGGEGGTEGDG